MTSDAIHDATDDHLNSQPSRQTDRCVNSLRLIATSVCVVALASCAATTYSYRSGDRRVGDAIGEPLRDTGWTRENPPEVLSRAAAAPYALPSVPECGALRDEISALDRVLGPDLDAADAPEEQSDIDASGLLSGAIGGLVGLPYRSIVRRVSGAAERERTLRDAIFAGMVRRAFLKGVARAVCAPVAVDEAAPSVIAPEVWQSPPPQQP